jgi:hypothetical protein
MLYAVFVKFMLCAVVAAAVPCVYHITTELATLGGSQSSALLVSCNGTLWSRCSGCCLWYNTADSA